MRHALILALTLGLASCGLTGPKHGSAPDAAAPGAVAPAGITTGQIEVTPLDAPAAAEAPPIAAQAVAAQAAAAATPAATAKSAPAAETIPVQKADATTPHPKARPAALGTTTETPPPEPPKSQAQVLCETAGGVWGQASDSGAYLCQKRTPDGGKVCHAKGDCQGECLALSGTCSPVRPLLGCNDVLDKEGRQVTLCLN